MRSMSPQRRYQPTSVTSKSDNKAASSDNKEDKEESDDDESLPSLERVTLMKVNQSQSSMRSIDNVMDQDITESQKSSCFLQGLECTGYC